MQGHIAFIFIAICLLISACGNGPDYIRLEKGFYAEVEVFSLQYKKGIDSARTAKPSFRYFDVEVVHTRDTFYTIWQEKVRIISPSDSGMSELELMMQKPIYDKGLKAEYSIYKDGVLGDLLNWPEIESFVDSTSWDYMRQYASDQNRQENYEMIMQHYNTQQTIETKMYKCISIFHAPYGMHVDTSDTESERVFDIDMIINPVKEKLLWYHKDGDRLFFLFSYPEISTDFGQTFLEPFVEIGMPDSVVNYMSQLSFTDTLYCDFNLEESRLNTATFNRTMHVQEDTYVEMIQLKVHSRSDP